MSWTDRDMESDPIPADDFLAADPEYATWSAEREAEYIAALDAELAADEALRGVEVSTYRRYSVGDALFASNPFD